MTRPRTTESHLTCPTCWGDISDKKDLAYFVSASRGPLKNDDVSNMYEEVSRLVRFLGALAQAGPKAVAQAEGPSEEWIEHLAWLAEELAEETERRLLLLENAGQIWKQRAEQGPERKGG
jgi:hypothetical protein